MRQAVGRQSDNLKKLFALFTACLMPHAYSIAGTGRPVFATPGRKGRKRPADH
jgi:sulfur relay (sulfurtransferase) DsrC/TusE family protein